jgi:hypothetical protein
LEIDGGGKGGGKGDGGCQEFSGDGTLVTSIFSCPPSFGDGTTDLMSVLRHIPRGSIESKLVCVYLNVLDGNAPSLSVADAQTWWNNLVCLGVDPYLGMTLEEWKMYLDSLWEEVT